MILCSRMELISLAPAPAAFMAVVAIPLLATPARFPAFCPCQMVPLTLQLYLTGIIITRRSIGKGFNDFRALYAVVITHIYHQNDCNTVENYFKPV